MRVGAAGAAFTGRPSQAGTALVGRAHRLGFARGLRGGGRGLVALPDDERVEVEAASAALRKLRAGGGVPVALTVKADR